MTGMDDEPSRSGHLVLSRHVDQEVVLIVPGYPYRIVVGVVAIRGDKVRLGFRAPGDVVIHRKEVMDKIDGESLESA
jgi:carbon storage regulator